MTIRNLMALVLAAALLMWARREVLIARDAESAARAWLGRSEEINWLKRDLKRGYAEIGIRGCGIKRIHLFGHAEVLLIRGRIAELEQAELKQLGWYVARLGMGTSAAKATLANQELGLPPSATGIQRIVARLQGKGKPTPEDIAYREELKSHG